MLLTVFLSSPCFAKDIFVRMYLPKKHFSSSPKAYEEVFTSLYSNGFIAVSGNFGKMQALPSQIKEGHFSISTFGGMTSVPNYVKEALEVGKRGDMKFVEWDFIVPEDYHHSDKIVAYPKSVEELYAKIEESMSYELETTEILKQPEIIYQAGSSYVPFYQGHLPLDIITKFGPNGGGGGGPYKAQFFSWKQGAMSGELIQEFVEAVEDSYGGKVEIIPFYMNEDFNSPDMVSHFHQQRVVSERELEAIKAEYGGVPQMFLNGIKEGETVFDPKFSVANTLENHRAVAEELARGGVVGFNMEAPEVSAFKYEGWAAYVNSRIKEAGGYGLSGFSHAIKDYSSMKGMMIIGPNGGGGGGPYMIGQ